MSIPRIANRLSCHQLSFGLLLTFSLMGCSTTIDSTKTLADEQDAAVLNPTRPPAKTIPRGPDGQLRLRATVARALAYSPEVDQVELALASAELNVASARDQFFPTLSSAVRSNAENTAGYELNVSQPLFDFGLRQANLLGAKARQLGSAQDRVATSEETAFNGAMAHILIKRNEALKRVAQDNVAAHKTFLDLANTRLEGGVDDRADVDLAEVRLATAKSSLVAFEETLVEARAAYTILTGEQPQRLADVSPLAFKTSSLTDPGALARNAPVVLQAQAEVDAARANITVERSALLPELQAEANFTDAYTGDRRSVIGLRLTGPTLTGLSQLRNVTTAKLEMRTAELEVERLRREVEDSLSGIIANDIKLAREQSILSGQLTRAEKLRSVYQDQFQIGSRAISDLVSVQNDIYGIAITLANDKYDQLLLQFQALSLLGRLQQELGLIEPPQTATREMNAIASEDALNQNDTAMTSRRSP